MGVLQDIRNRAIFMRGYREGVAGTAEEMKEALSEAGRMAGSEGLDPDAAWQQTREDFGLFEPDGDDDGDDGDEAEGDDDGDREANDV